MAKYREAFAKRMATAGLKPHHRIGELDSGLLNVTNRWADVDEQGYSYGFSAAVNMSIAILPMSQEFNWNNATVGLIHSSFFWGYLFTQIVGGIWADKIGGKLVLGFGVIWWSATTVLTPIVAKVGLPFLLVMRAFMGIGDFSLFLCSFEGKCQIEGSTILFIGSKETGLSSFQFWMRGFCGIHLMTTTLYSQNIFCVAADVSDVDCILNCDSESVSISASNLEAYLHLPIVNSKLDRFSLLRNLLFVLNFAKINLRRGKKLLVCCNNDKKCNRISCSSYCHGFRCLNTYIGHPRPCEVDLLQL